MPSRQRILSQVKLRFSVSMLRIAVANRWFPVAKLGTGDSASRLGAAGVDPFSLAKDLRFDSKRPHIEMIWNDASQVALFGFKAPGRRCEPSFPRFKASDPRCARRDSRFRRANAVWHLRRRPTRLPTKPSELAGYIVAASAPHTS